MNYYKFRYTFDTEVNETHYISCFDTIFIQRLKADKWTCGIEEMNSMGEKVSKHIHIHFTSTDKKGNIRARLTRYWKEQAKQEGIEYDGGNKLYSLKEEKNVDDYDRFFRYPLKQNGRELDKKQNPPDDFNLEEQRKIANEEWKRDIGFNIEKKKREQAKESTYDKLEKYIKDNIKDGEKREIMALVLKYYTENKLSANFRTMMGYVNTYRMLNGLMSYEEAMDKMEKYE